MKPDIRKLIGAMKPEDLDRLDTEWWARTLDCTGITLEEIESAKAEYLEYHGAVPALRRLGEEHDG